ncbi:MAG: ATP-dependent 6-phosphofructokinase [bacterium]|nr:ATP-dependent 6-phosphofructokinase [bacterium]
MKTFGVLTGGGDCPGLNAVLVGVVRKAASLNHKIIGIRRGWAGMLEKDTVSLDREAVSGIVHRGGTILKTSRTNPCKTKEYMEKVKKNYAELKLDGLICVGGDDTLGAAHKLFQAGLKTIGVPKTIDNDLSGTDRTFGFDTAVNIAMEAIDRLHTTAESHDRVLVVEVMGRHAGWIAMYAGLAGGADVIMIPEVQMTMEEVCNIITGRHKRGRDFSIVAVAEGATIGGDFVTKDVPKDEFGHVRLGGLADIIAKEIEQRTGYETRTVVLGHLQRGGSPTAYDRWLGLWFGAKAVELADAGQFGKMVSLRGTKFIAVDLEEAVGQLSTVDPKDFDAARIFFG